MTGEVLVLHVDSDAFYASVEQRQKPSTVAVPVIICGLGPRGVVATASYQARRFGVGSAMATAVLARFADVLEQVSIDEAYLQVSAVNIAAERLAAEVTVQV